MFNLRKDGLGNICCDERTASCFLSRKLTADEISNLNVEVLEYSDFLIYRDSDDYITDRLNQPITTNAVED